MMLAETVWKCAQGYEASPDTPSGLPSKREKAEVVVHEAFARLWTKMPCDWSINESNQCTAWPVWLRLVRLALQQTSRLPIAPWRFHTGIRSTGTGFSQYESKRMKGDLEISGSSISQKGMGNNQSCEASLTDSQALWTMKPQDLSWRKVLEILMILDEACIAWYHGGSRSKAIFGLIMFSCLFSWGCGRQVETPPVNTWACESVVITLPGTNVLRNSKALY